ncbi:hypothetical protein ASPZODRAFT_28239 [Penicilliopsis zonata CBS 506.65]|uniref:C2H2-type domain-containing protein n=1 Tax=Penicilliopsis zonata CBS 506.65 TaxID=1073090 RepID=A0A1L9S8U6_9EURO|nr:hypothetical protein ASPZODRAFT_28239 [Penicilliopsis zonata CBS 506.65]OJJ43583.1 hypothetical protein ASPZODRAFT_28239 [Penicilliopsis zonata CBS 506.65]
MERPANQNVLTEDWDLTSGFPDLAALPLLGLGTASEADLFEYWATKSTGLQGPPLSSSASTGMLSLHPQSSPCNATNHQGQPSSQVPRQPAVFRCKWEGCRYSGSFNRIGDLLRHVRNIHVCPRSYPCPVQSCGEIFNRKDNLQEHMRRRHCD